MKLRNKNSSAFEFIYFIVNYGMGSKIIHRAKDLGVSGGTVFSGKGTIKSSLLNFLSLYDERKEVVSMATDNKTSAIVLDRLNQEFEFHKQNHGIAFTIAGLEVIGSSKFKTMKNARLIKEEKTMYQNIITIVNRGKAEEVVEAAQLAGARGGTIINARGSGIHETSKIFNFDIEPEKEVVIILAKVEVTNAIVDSIVKKLEIKKPGNGIVFVQNVSKVIGFYDK
jgi:nitrogen regulatory protein PII